MAVEAENEVRFQRTVRRGAATTVEEVVATEEVVGDEVAVAEETKVVRSHRTGRPEDAASAAEGQKAVGRGGLEGAE